MEEIVARLGKNLAELRQNFRSGRTRGLVWRKTQLRAILKLVAENEDEIFEALNRDLGKHPAEAYRDEIGVVKKSAEYSLHHIEKWMAPKKVSCFLKHYFVYCIKKHGITLQSELQGNNLNIKLKTLNIA
ncbi:aldehyde dehydrogenase family 3 member F1-like [Olea europaea var. sylvestris]|uniref:aldehyde dehydrogenase family 3 member F1-like n=1 Tax=Olea europaea var. sylvestris TaxID=158386 RepID=UPI000C1D2DDF|nr:aldehyde dehydrogenase family 3 member F1-like [Olea europaea var. sylvestris]